MWKSSAVPSCGRTCRKLLTWSSVQTSSSTFSLSFLIVCFPYTSFFASNSLTICGFAWPLDSFITWPTKEAHQFFALGLVRGQVLLHLGRVAPMHLVDHGLQCAAVADLLQAAALDNFVGAALALPHGLEHLLGDFAGDAVVQDTLDQAAQVVADTGLSRCSVRRG